MLNGLSRDENTVKMTLAPEGQTSPLPRAEDWTQLNLKGRNVKLQPRPKVSNLPSSLHSQPIAVKNTSFLPKDCVLGWWEHTARMGEQLKHTTFLFENAKRIAQLVQVLHTSRNAGFLHRVEWWLDSNVSEGRAASIFRAEMRGERKVDIDTGRVWGGLGLRIGDWVGPEPFWTRQRREKSQPLPGIEPPLSSL
jgi:hypothetical protein